MASSPMEEGTAGASELSSRLRDFEKELKGLRATLDHQAHAVGQINSNLASLQAQLAAGRQSPAEYSKWKRLATDWYVAVLHVLRRADVNGLFDRPYYLSRNPGLEQSGTDPVFHFLRSSSPVSPHWLFDRDYYLRMYPDVAAAKVEPLTHFLRSGWREGRDPHPLFRTEFYLQQVPSLKSGKLNPVLHYMQQGWRDGTQPHPLFDGAFYLRTYPDVVRAGMDPLTHYVLFGSSEGRRPHPWFDSDYYLQQNPDVATARVEPIQHYIEHGAAEGRDPHPLFDTGFYQEEIGSALGRMSALEHFVRYGEKEGRATVQTDCTARFLPATKYIPPPPRGGIIDIVVPVYRGFAETCACIESVLACRNRESWELVVIDDLSPEPRLSAWLRDNAAAGRFTLLHNETNLGFVSTVNRGMSVHLDRDVVLLNSDTTVANDWLDRLAACAYGHQRVGTVTPFSNNATICSYPRFCEDNPLPNEATASELDRLAAVANQGRSIDLPTAVGFCMYIRRDCLNEVGLFDVETFGKGYGEENDFSLRASAKGWRNLLAADVFVYHAGSVSFAKGAFLLRERGVRALTDRYPKYSALISWHVARDAALPYRFALTAARFRASPRPTILIVTHDMGGGIRQHIEELVESQAGKAHFLELQPTGGTHVLLRSLDPADSISLRLDADRQYDALVGLLRSCNISRIHIHQVLRHPVSIEKLRHDLNVPMDFTVHDYMAICPRFVLAKPDGRYCGEPDESGCNECIRTTLPHLNLDIASWRAKYSWLVTSADRVIAPSADAGSRMSRRFPTANIQAAGHPLQLTSAALPAIHAPKLVPGDKLRIAALGVMTWHKGLALLEQCARLAADRDLPLEFVLVGFCEPQVRDAGPFSFRETGEYSRPDLPAILAETDPGLMWFPQRWPETFSYTLSVCLEQGLPIAATQLGALPERLSNRAWTWTYDWDSSAEELLELFGRIRESMISGIPPRLSAALRQAEPAFYTGGYIGKRTTRVIVPRQPAVDLRESGRLSVVAILASYASGQLQSCGYIRAYLPLTHDQAESQLRVTVGTPESALDTISDILLVQRTAVATLPMAEQLVKHCERHGIRLVYETDDDLFNIDPNHPEKLFYAQLLQPARWIARHAAVILVSSPHLKQRLADLNPHIRVIPNALDETLWFTGKKPFRPDRKPVRILYMGTMTHSHDLQILEEPMRALKAEFGAAVELDLIGIMPNAGKRDWFNTVEVPGIHGHSYLLFTEWIRRENRWDIGVAPLVDDQFNRSKSYIKYLDYAALGLPGIFSAIGVFEQVVKEGETGLCVPDIASWYDALRLLITDRMLRRKMAQAAYRDVEANHTLGAQAALRHELWAQIGNLPPVRSSNTIVSFSDETTAATSNGL